MTTTEYLEKKFGPHKGNPHVLPFEREGMYQLFGELGLNRGVEIGIEKGKNAQTMFENMPNLKLYGVDSFIEHPQVSHYSIARERNWDPHWFARVKRQCKKRLQGRDYEFLEGFSEIVVQQVPDNSLDFVYLDSDHSYDFVMHDIIMWGRKLKKGGIMSGHDYYTGHDRTHRREKVVQAVNDYTNVHGIKFYVTNEVHGAKSSDYYPSWFWVKEEDIWPNII